MSSEGDMASGRWAGLKMPIYKMLDLDLDFFLNKIATDKRDDGPRLSGRDFRPWGPVKIRKYLEKVYGLSRENPIPGKLVTHHDEAFYWWRDLISRHLIDTPFEVVHVDAHSDTGGPFTYDYIMTELLKLPVEQRSDPKTGNSGLNPGNYLCFAVACRWLSRIVYVLHPKAGDDFGVWHFKDQNPFSGFMQLKKCETDAIKGFHNAVYGPKHFEPEPDVPYEMVIDYELETPFTHGLLCQSPGFTPKSADRLIPIIMEYFEQ